MLKLLQIQPDREIIVEFIKNEDYKYVRVLGACGPPGQVECSCVCAGLGYAGERGRQRGGGREWVRARMGVRVCICTGACMLATISA